MLGNHGVLFKCTCVLLMEFLSSALSTVKGFIGKVHSHQFLQKSIHFFVSSALPFDCLVSVHLLALSVFGLWTIFLGIKVPAIPHRQGIDESVLPVLQYFRSSVSAKEISQTGKFAGLTALTE